MNASCPICRRVFFTEELKESKVEVVHRLQIWDEAYASAGIRPSEKEPRFRKYLCEYVR